MAFRSRRRPPSRTVSPAVGIGRRSGKHTRSPRPVLQIRSCHDPPEANPGRGTSSHDIAVSAEQPLEQVIIKLSAQPPREPRRTRIEPPSNHHNFPPSRPCARCGSANHACQQARKNTSSTKVAPATRRSGRAVASATLSGGWHHDLTLSPDEPSGHRGIATM